MAQQDFGTLLTDGRFNAGLAWGLTGLFGVTAVESLVTGDPLWTAFAIVCAGLVITPAVSLQNPRAMPPWEVVLLAGLPVLGRSLATLPVTGDVATYLSVAAIALVLAVDMHLFTPVEMSVGFAVLFVVVGTLAAAGVWAVVRWISDLYLGTELLLAPGLSRGEIEHDLMLEFVASSIAGLFAGTVFEGYVRRRSRADLRLPEETP